MANCLSGKIAVAYRSNCCSCLLFCRSQCADHRACLQVQALQQEQVTCGLEAVILIVIVNNMTVQTGGDMVAQCA